MARGKLLICGGNGHLGSRVTELLGDRPEQLIVTSRDPASLRHLEARGIEVRHADYDREETLAAAFTGAERILLISTHDVGRRSIQIANAANAAKAAGVQHICYTSTAGAQPGKHDIITDDHFWSEHAIVSTGLGFTILRHNMYSEHIFLALSVGVASGVLSSTIGTNGRGYVTRDDCARADAGALISDNNESRIFDVTGPELVTHTDIAAYATRLSGRPVRYEAVSKPEAIRRWIDGGLRPIVAETMAEYDALAGQGYHAMVTPVVRELGGTEPETVLSFLTRNAADLQPDENGRAIIDEHMDRPARATADA